MLSTASPVCVCILFKFLTHCVCVCVCVCACWQAARQWTVEEILSGVISDDVDSQLQATQAARSVTTHLTVPIKLLPG